jgi:glycosyltransferase involved in cell wall biosynthesis
MILLSHPTGNANVRALLRGVVAAGLDYRFFTTIACDGNERWLRRLPSGWRSELLRRSYPGLKKRIYTQPWREGLRLVAKRLGCLPAWVAHERGWASVDAVYHSLDRTVATGIRAARTLAGSVVHAYEDGALETFRAAHQQGMTCSYELPIAYWETAHRLLQEEAQRYPDWEPTLMGTRDSAAKLRRKTEELEAADTVICPSRFVWRSLPASIRREKRCVLAPFGSPPVRPLERRERVAGPMRVLFAGSLTQRKGLADLFQAINRLERSDVELVVVGSLMQPLSFYEHRCRRMIYERPRPHHEVLALMQRCDVLVLPSLVEGRALVQQEAMSCGLPLIATANAGGEDLIEEGRTGFLVPIRDPDTLAERIAWLADHRAALAEMSECARSKAAAVTWEAYAEHVIRSFARPASGGAASVAIFQPQAEVVRENA